MFNFGGFTYASHSHKHTTRGLDTIEATSFFPQWLLLFFEENLEAKEVCKKSLEIISV